MGHAFMGRVCDKGGWWSGGPPLTIHTNKTCTQLTTLHAIRRPHIHSAGCSSLVCASVPASTERAGVCEDRPRQPQRVQTRGAHSFSASHAVSFLLRTQNNDLAAFRLLRSPIGIGSDCWGEGVCGRGPGS